MTWFQLIVFILATEALFIWNRSRSKADIKEITHMIEDIKKENLEFSKALRKDKLEILMELGNQNKKFDDYLASIEEKKKVKGKKEG